MTSNKMDNESEPIKYIWKSRQFNYKADAKNRKANSVLVGSSQYHPLKPIIVTDAVALKVVHHDNKNKSADSASTQSQPKSDIVKSVSDFVDPLSAMAMSDPLSTAVVEDKKKVVEDVKNETEICEDGFESWSSREFVKKALATGVGPRETKKYQPGLSVSTKLKDRLGELDDFEEGGFLEMQNLSQQEFLHRIERLNQTLTEAWNANKKVQSLKIAIQCSKLLGKIAVMSFYPSKFVLVSSLLDTFGSLVFQRILSMCGKMDPDNLVPEEVPENAREICINWLLKIASIRELLPRLYIEAATLHCNEFLKRGESKSVLVRLTSMARGVGDPLVAVYVRTYLCRVGQLYIPEFKGHLKSNLYDFISTYKQIHTAPVQNLMAAQKTDMASYLSYYTPALEWILSCLAHKAHEATLTEVTEKCEKDVSSLLLFNCCVASFKAEFIASRALVFTSIINKSQDQLFPKYVVYRSLGRKVIEADPPEEERLVLLNEVWKVLVKIRNPEHYISCVEVWIEYVAKNFSRKEVNTVLNDVIKHMIPDRAFEKHYSELQSITSKILEHMSDFSDIFSMEKFLPFLDLFQKEENKVEVCKLVTEAFTRDPKTTTSDTITINGLMYICKALHDSVNAMSLDDDKKIVSSLINDVILKVTFGKDFEQQLSFYVECRASFRGLDSVLMCLVHAVNKLSARVTTIVKGNHTRKTAAFVRACTAYSFITIPSLVDIQSRLWLYLESGQVALISQCITQADAMYKSAVSMLYELATAHDGKKAYSQQVFMNYVVTFMSSLLTVPDNTEQGVAYLLRGLLNVISESRMIIADVKCMIYIKVLSLLTAYSQDRYLYTVNKVDSNESMYSRDPKFLAELEKISSTVLDEILKYLTSVRQQQELKAQSTCAFHLFETIVAHGDVRDENMQHLAVTAWDLTNKHGYGQTKVMVRMLEHLKKSGDPFKQFANALQLQTRT